MSTLEDFLIKRWQLLAVEEEKARALYADQLAAINSERAQLQAAAAAAGVNLFPSTPQATPPAPATPPATATATPPAPAKLRRKRIASTKTIKTAVVEVLKDAGAGLTANDILPRINKLLGVDYPRSSLSPQLSRLARDGEIIREKKFWRLASSQKDMASQSGNNLVNLDLTSMLK